MSLSLPEHATLPPSVSVLMPVLNPHPAYFPEAIESVLAQTMPDWELIIVEAPGETSAATLLARYNDPRIRHVANPTRTSLVAQRNQTVSLARAPWLAMLDADDVCEPERLEKQLAAVAASGDIDVLGSQLTIIGPGSERIGVRAYPITHDHIARAMRRFNSIAQSTVLLRRETVLAVGGYQYQRYPVAEDYDLWCRLLASGARFANHPHALTRYRIQPAQTKSQRLREHLLATLDIKRTYWQSVLNLGDRVRMGVERLLLWVPPALVLKLFTISQFRRPTKL